MPPTYPPTDLGNAQRLADANSRDLRYDVHTRRWLAYTGAHWAVDDTGAVHRRAHEIARAITNSAERLSDRDRRDAVRHAYRTETPRRLRAMVDLARHLLPVTSDQLDRDPWQLNVHNGTLDLKTSTLHPHNPDDLITKLAPVDYDPDAACPRWQQFLQEVFQGNEALIAYAQRLAGYLLTGLTNEQSLFVLHGTGANGKSVFLHTLAALLGDYAHHTPFATIERTRRQTTPGLAALHGARLVIAGAPEGTQVANTALLKQLSSGEPVTARLPRRDPVTYRPTAKLCFALNDIPNLHGAADTVRHHLQVLPFEQTYSTTHRDIHLRDTLQQELPGILNWALAGLAAWQAQGLCPPPAVVQHTQTLLDLQDPLAAFVDQIVTPDPDGAVEIAHLYQAYRLWCQRTHTPVAFTQPQTFTRALLQRPGIGRVRTNTTRYLTGITLETMYGPTKPDAAKDARRLQALGVEFTQLIDQLHTRKPTAATGKNETIPQKLVTPRELSSPTTPAQTERTGVHIPHSPRTERPSRDCPLPPAKG